MTSWLRLWSLLVLLLKLKGKNTDHVLLKNLCVKTEISTLLHYYATCLATRIPIRA